jgi:hypothetical protein
VSDSESDAPTGSVCRVPGCGRPVHSLFPGKPSNVCAGHGIEALAQFFEMEMEGDTAKDIHAHEQFGAWLRDKTGIGIRYSPNDQADPAREKTS